MPSGGWGDVRCRWDGGRREVTLNAMLIISAARNFPGQIRLSSSSDLATPQFWQLTRQATLPPQMEFRLRNSLFFLCSRKGGKPHLSVYNEKTHITKRIYLSKKKRIPICLRKKQNANGTSGKSRFGSRSSIEGAKYSLGEGRCYVWIYPGYFRGPYHHVDRKFPRGLLGGAFLPFTEWSCLFLCVWVAPPRRATPPPPCVKVEQGRRIQQFGERPLRLR